MLVKKLFFISFRIDIDTTFSMLILESP